MEKLLPEDHEPLDPPKPEAKRVIGNFQEEYKKWQAEEYIKATQVSEATEPELCACGNQIISFPLDDEESMELDKTYCNQTYQYRRTQDERKMPSGKYYTPKAPLIAYVGECSAQVKLNRVKATAIAAGQYTTPPPDSKPMKFETFIRDSKNTSLEKAFELAMHFKINDRMFFWGTTGLGKTHLTRAIYIGLFAAGIKAQWVTAQEMADTFQEMQSWREDSLEKDKAKSRNIAWQNSEVLFIDDLGSEKIPKTKATDENPHHVFRAGLKALLEHHRGGRVITTNLFLSKAKAHGEAESVETLYGDKLYDRLIEGMMIHQLLGVSYRQKSTRVTK